MSQVGTCYYGCPVYKSVHTHAQVHLIHYNIYQNYIISPINYI